MERQIEQTISIPVEILEALFIAMSTGDRNALQNVGAQIKELAEDQAPEKFPTHRKLERVK